MTRLGAAWVVPIDQPPIRDGWVAVEGGRILAVGQGNGPEATRVPARSGRWARSPCCRAS